MRAIARSPQRRTRSSDGFGSATATPEAAVLDRDGKVVYLGRIDDAYYGFGKRRSSATSQDLRDALDAVLDGKPVPHPRTTVLGCEIPPPL